MMAPRGINIKCVSFDVNFMLFRGRKSFRHCLNIRRDKAISFEMFFCFLFSLEKHLNELLVPLKWNLNESHWQFDQNANERLKKASSLQELKTKHRKMAENESMETAPSTRWFQANCFCGFQS